MTAVLVCGLQGSGKSTFVKRAFADTHVRLNLDMLRTRNREDILLHACLAAQAPFVVDNTNPTADQRTRYVRLAHAAGFEVHCYYLDTPPAECVARNATRPESARVPDVAIYGAAAKWQTPTRAEGYTRLFKVTATAGEFTLEELP